MWAPIWPDVPDDRAAGRARSPTASTCRPGCRPSMARAVRRATSAPTGASATTIRRCGTRVLDDPRRGAVGRAPGAAPATCSRSSASARAQRWTRGARQRRRASSPPARCSIPNALTIGFARRFTGYKRPELIFHDPERLRAHPQRAGPAGADRLRRQGASGRRHRQAPPAAASTGARSIRCSAAASRSSTTTTCTSRTSSCRAATSG